MSETLQYRLADVDIEIQAPADILGIARESYMRFASTKGLAEPRITVRAHVNEDCQIVIEIGDREYTRVAPAAGRGAIGLELSNAIITGVAQHSHFLIMHAAALERNGKALCIAARGFGGKTLLAAHLVARGWKILSDEYAFIEPSTGHVVPFQKLLYMRSSSLPYLPRSFRKCVEHSPWYGMGRNPGLVFSGVDPAESYGEPVWSHGATIAHLLVLTKRSAAGPVISPCKGWSVVPELNTLVWQPPDMLEGLSRIAAALRGVEVAELIAGSPIHTANAIEWWAGREERLYAHA